MYYIGNMITRVWLSRVLLRPKDSVQVLLKEFMASIFKDEKFWWGDFLTVGTPLHTVMTENELNSANLVQEACLSITKHLGGKDATSRFTATYVVLFQKEATRSMLSKYRSGDQKIINFRYITECYFQHMRIKLDEQTEQDFGIPFFIKEKK